MVGQALRLGAFTRGLPRAQGSRLVSAASRTHSSHSVPCSPCAQEVLRVSAAKTPCVLTIVHGAVHAHCSSSAHVCVQVPRPWTVSASA